MDPRVRSVAGALSFVSFAISSKVSSSPVYKLLLMAVHITFLHKACDEGHTYDIVASNICFIGIGLLTAL